RRTRDCSRVPMLRRGWRDRWYRGPKETPAATPPSSRPRRANRETFCELRFAKLLLRRPASHVGARVLLRAPATHAGRRGIRLRRIPAVALPACWRARTFEAPVARPSPTARERNGGVEAASASNRRTREHAGGVGAGICRRQMPPHPT